MERIPEPELMLESDQAKAYAEGDFEQAHEMFIDLCHKQFPSMHDFKNILDLGCGTGDISLRLIRRFPDFQIVGVDGSNAMLHWAKEAYKNQARKGENIRWVEGYLPDVKLDGPPFDLIVSNSLLHHLHQPKVLWESIKKYTNSETCVFIMDLFRADSADHAAELVDLYAANEPAVLKQDFYNSLCAAFSIEEVQEQIIDAGLLFNIQKVSDRHMMIYGKI